MKPDKILEVMHKIWNNGIGKEEYEEVMLVIFALLPVRGELKEKTHEIPISISPIKKVKKPIRLRPPLTDLLKDFIGHFNPKNPPCILDLTKATGRSVQRVYSSITRLRRCGIKVERFKDNAGISRYILQDAPFDTRAA